MVRLYEQAAKRRAEARFLSDFYPLKMYENHEKMYENYETLLTFVVQCDIIIPIEQERPAFIRAKKTRPLSSVKQKQIREDAIFLRISNS